MPVQPPLSAREEEIHRALARLVSGGPDSVWLPEVQPLLELPAVEERMETGHEAAGDALRAVLLKAIEELGQSQYRNLLEIVLGLTQESAELTAGARRDLAGKRFRGGKRPVTAGTIRQHHERRALAELATRLVSEMGPASPGRPEAQEWIEWHPRVREAWAGQRLNLWRISISDYDSKEVLEVLPALMRKHKVGGWGAYEMFGVFDLLVEAWLPANVWAAVFERALEEAFGDRLVRCDAFAVDEVMMHWVWQGEKGEMRLPPRPLLREPPPERQLARLRTDDEKQLSRYFRRNAAARVVAEPGIGLLIAITGLQGHPLLSVSERDLVKRLILGAVMEAEADVLFQTVLLRGSGFADYLLQGRVRPEAFHRMQEGLVIPLNEALRSAGMRTHTFVLSGPGPLVREQGLQWNPAVEAQSPVKDVLREHESATLEVRSSGFVDLLPDGRVGAVWANSEAAKGLTRTIAAMLNSRGGTIVVGASPHSRAEDDPRFTGKRIRGAPVIGDYVVIGVDEEIAGKPDSYLRRAREMCQRFIEPDPGFHLELRLEQIEDRTVLVISIPRSDEWFYFLKDSKDAVFVVRDSAGTSRFLRGVEIDSYKRQFPRF